MKICFNGFDRLIAIKDLKKNKFQRNKHTKEQIQRLAKIMRECGIRHPIHISKLSGEICFGHGRLEAAKFNKWKEFPVVYQDFENETQEYLCVQNDNSIAHWADLDLYEINKDLENMGPFDLDLLGIENFELNASEKIPMCDEDEVPEKVEPKTKRGYIYKLGSHRLMCGDSTSIDDVEKLMDGDKADMVFTDPPYGINEETDRDFASRTRLTKGNTFHKIIGDDSIDTAVAAYSVADSIAPIVIYWGGNYYAHKLPPSPCWAVWDKRVEEKQRDMNSDCELAYVKHPSKESVRIFRHLWKGMIKASEHGDGRVHPTQKPIALAEWTFEEFASTAINVIDLFGGSGSTLIACEKTNRKCFMMELDPHYCDVIVSRWEKYTGKKGELIK